MTELRTGRTLSQTPGLCTLYEVAPGDDRMADTCIGKVVRAGVERTGKPGRPAHLWGLPEWERTEAGRQ
jgi:hypothetical protein